MTRGEVQKAPGTLWTQISTLITSRYKDMGKDAAMVGTRTEVQEMTGTKL